MDFLLGTPISTTTSSMSTGLIGMFSVSNNIDIVYNLIAGIVIISIVVLLLFVILVIIIVLAKKKKWNKTLSRQRVSEDKTEMVLLLSNFVIFTSHFSILT